MTSSTNSPSFPYIRVRVTIKQPRVSRQQVIDLDAMIDTGFDGGVVIPRDLLDPTLEPVRYLPWSLADDSEILLPAFAGTVEIGSLPPVATVIMPLGDNSLLGRHVTDNFRVIFDHGQRVIVEQ